MYTSYIIADIQIENDMNEEDAAMLLVGCMGKETQDLYRLGLQNRATLLARERTNSFFRRM